MSRIAKLCVRIVAPAETTVVFVGHNGADAAIRGRGTATPAMTVEVAAPPTGTIIVRVYKPIHIADINANARRVIGVGLITPAMLTRGSGMVACSLFDGELAETVAHVELLAGTALADDVPTETMARPVALAQASGLRNPAGDLACDGALCQLFELRDDGFIGDALRNRVFQARLDFFTKTPPAARKFLDYCALDMPRYGFSQWFEYNQQSMLMRGRAAPISAARSFERQLHLAARMLWFLTITAGSPWTAASLPSPFGVRTDKFAAEFARGFRTKSTMPGVFRAYVLIAMHMLTVLPQCAAYYPDATTASGNEGVDSVDDIVDCGAGDCEDFAIRALLTVREVRALAALPQVAAAHPAIAVLASIFELYAFLPTMGTLMMQIHLYQDGDKPAGNAARDAMEQGMHAWLTAVPLAFLHGTTMQPAVVCREQQSRIDRSVDLCAMGAMVIDATNPMLPSLRDVLDLFPEHPAVGTALDAQSHAWKNAFGSTTWHPYRQQLRGTLLSTLSIDTPHLHDTEAGTVHRIAEFLLPPEWTCIAKTGAVAPSWAPLWNGTTHASLADFNRAVMAGGMSQLTLAAPVCYSPSQWQWMAHYAQIHLMPRTPQLGTAAYEAPVESGALAGVQGGHGLEFHMPLSAIPCIPDALKNCGAKCALASRATVSDETADGAPELGIAMYHFCE